MVRGNLDTSLQYIWGKALFCTLEFLSVDILKSKVRFLFLFFKFLTIKFVNYLLTLADPSNSVHLRILSCQGIGALSKFPAVIPSLLAQALALCQDTDQEVRACMAFQIPSIARCMG